MRFLLVPLLALSLACGGKGPGPASPATGASSAAAAPTTEGAEQELLAGRIKVRLPEGAKVSARPHSVMAAPGSVEEESRVLLVPGKPYARFVMIVSEVFELGSGNAVADATEFVRADAEERYRVEALPVGAGLEAAAYVPEGRADGEHPSLVLGALVEAGDASLLSVQFYILPEMKPESATWRAQAKQILGSFAAGPRKLDLSAGETKVPLGDQDLVLARPAGFCLTAQPGPDFDVYHLRKVVRSGAPPTTIGVYVGGHPSFQYRQAEPPVANVGAVPGTFLGQATSFSEWQPFPNVQRREAIVKVGERDFVHVFATAAQSSMPELMTVVSNMKVVKRAVPAK